MYSEVHDTLHSKKLRIAIYSHDTMGLGHMRRNQLIAHTLARSPLKPVILMINGAYEVNCFPRPPGTDYLSLPALCKDIDGNYRSRCLDINLHELITLRSNAIRSILERFMPDVFIVDKVPRGALGELDPVLKSLCATGRTHCVLGLRDVLDDPATIRSEWEREKYEDTIRHYYEAIWVYGDPAVYDLVHEYHLSPDIASKVQYMGYLDQCLRPTFAEVRKDDLHTDLELPPGRFILCLVGGGQDGAYLAETFAHANLPQETYGIILTGPFMPDEVQKRLHGYSAGIPRLRVLNFINEPEPFIAHADRIVSMGGYNSICEILSFQKRALIVPRVKPRLEQMIRAERMSEMGLIDVLHPGKLSPQALADWMDRDLPAINTCDRIDLNGLARIPCRVYEMMSGYCLPENRFESEGIPNVVR